MVDEAGFGGGVLLLGQDPLARESYSGLVGFVPRSRRLSYAIGAQSYSVPRTSVYVEAVDLARPTSQEIPGSETAYLWRRDRVQAARVGWPFYRMRWQFEPYAGFRRTEVDTLAPIDWTLQDLPRPDFITGRTMSWNLGVGYSNARRHPLSFSLTDGVATNLEWWTRTHTLGGDRLGSGAMLDLRMYRSLHRDVVIAARGLTMRGPDIEIGPGTLIDLHGINTTRVISRGLMGAGEVRFRITELQQRAFWDWIYLNRVHAAVFLQGAWHDTEARTGWSQLRSLVSTGARVSLDVTLGFIAGETLDLVLAVPSPGDPAIYLSFSSAF